MVIKTKRYYKIQAQLKSVRLMKGPNESKSNEPRNIPKTRVPLTLKLLSECLENQNSAIDGHQFSQAVIVAKLINHALQANKEILTFQDGTLELSVTRFKAEEDLTIGKYYKFFVSVSKAGNQFRLYCREIRQVEDMNVLTDHLLSVIARHLQRTKGFIKK